LGKYIFLYIYINLSLSLGKNFDGKTADIWAGGVTLYQMVYGKVPFSSTSTVQLKSQIMT
jgi:[calcium/calmodulin-dependent protein kinase] kinase